MSNLPNTMEKQMDVEIGGEVFHLYFEKWNHRWNHALGKNYGDYITHSKKTGCHVQVIPYSDGRHFIWKPSELERFREFFLNIHQRYPGNGPVEEAAESSLDILQTLDPEKNSMKDIRSCMDEPQTLIYLRIGSDLYFIDIQSRNAYFFIRERTRQIPWLNVLIKNRSSEDMGMMNGMMFLLSHRLIHHGGLLLHGAAVRKEDQAVLFLGLSGAGKSTVSRLCRPDVCFSDDGTIIKKEEGRVYAYHSPFRQYKIKERSVESVKGEIKKLFLIEQSTENLIRPIKKNELMSTILLHLIHFYKYLDQETARMGFYLVKDILETLPAYRLQFAKKSDIWNHLFQMEENCND